MAQLSVSGRVPEGPGALQSEPCRADPVVGLGALCICLGEPNSQDPEPLRAELGFGSALSPLHCSWGSLT